MKVEQWKDVLGYEGLYQVSNIGNVKSLDRVDPSGHKRIGKEKAKTLRNGYLSTTIFKDGVSKICNINILVLEAFVGKRPSGMESCHNNGIKTDNKLENLRWDTHSGNAKDLIIHGTCHFKNKKFLGEDATNCKIKKHEVGMIRFLKKLNMFTNRQIGNLYSISLGQVSRIANGRSWSWL